MKLKLLLVSLILITSISLFGQSKDLILKNRNNGYERYIQEESTISVSCVSGKYITGELKIINDSEIMLGSDTINVNKINTIKYTRSILSKITNGILISSGAFLMDAGITSIIDESERRYKVNFPTDPVIAIVVFGALTATNSVIRLVTRRKYHHEKWEYIIRIE